MGRRDDVRDRSAWPERCFRPGPVPDRPAEELGRLHARLRAGLIAAHAQGLSFFLRLTGGPEPRLTLGCDDARSERWIARVLAPAYGPNAWALVPVAPRVQLPRARVVGRRRGLPGERSGTGGDPGAIVPALVAGLATLSRRASVHARFRPWGPALPPRSRPVSSSPWALPVPRPAGPPRSGRAPYSTASPIASPVEVRPPFWSAEVLLTTGGRTDLRDLRAVVEGAFLALDGEGFSFAGGWATRLRAGTSLLTESELVALLPTFRCEGTGAVDGVAAHGLPVGRSAAGSPVRLPVEPGQGRHAVILGETGMGKSSLLVALAARAARQGALVVLDPLGGTARAVRDELLSAGRAVRFVAPGVPGMRLNVLDTGEQGASGPAATAERRVSDLVHALRSIRTGRYGEAGFWGPRLEEMLGRALAAAASLPHGTVEDAHAILAGSASGPRRIPHGTEVLVREVTERVRDRPDDAEGARRLLYEIVHDPTLCSMLAAREPDLRSKDLVVPGGAVVISGEAASVGATTARYLLAVYLGVVWSELLARPERTKTFVLLDEAQWFAHESLAEMLRLGRGYDVHTIVATQGLGSLAEDVRDAIRTNASDLVAFRGSPDDARALARSVPGVGEERLLALPRGSALVLLGKGERQNWVRTARRPGLADRAPAYPGGLRSPAEPAGAAPRGGGTGVPPSLAEILTVLRDESQRLPPGELLRVDVARRLFLSDDPEGGRTVRSLGGWLGRCGALVRAERSDTGPVWWLDPARLGAEGHPDAG